MTGVLQLHACRTHSRTPHAGFLTLHTDSVWSSGTSARCVKSRISIRKQSGTRGVSSMYSSRCSGRRRMAPSLGYIFTDRVASIPSLRYRYRLGHPLLRNRQTTSPTHVTSRHLPLWPVYPYIRPNTHSLVFPWYPVRGQAPQFRAHPRILLFPDVAFLPLVRQSCLRSRTAIPEPRFRLTLRSPVLVRPVPL